MRLRLVPLLGLFAVLALLALALPLWPDSARVQEAPAEQAEQAEQAAPLTVFFLNAGQGDAVLLVTPDGTTAMIDAGDTAAGPGLVRFLGDTTSSVGLKERPHRI